MATVKKPITPKKPVVAQGAKGALSKDPEFVIGTTEPRLKDQLARWNKRLKAGDKTAKARIAEIQGALSALPQNPAEQTPEQKATEQYYQTMDQAGGVQQDLLKEAKDQGDFDPTKMGVNQIQQFQPGDFQQQFQGAYDNALNQFNRSSEPAFTKQKQDFDQMIAERGIDPTSEQYKQMYKARISDPQETARLNAQDAAYQTGLGAQNQAYSQASGTYGQNLGAQGQQFGQATTQYQMPYQNLNALSPYLQAQYGQQSAQQQQGFTQANMGLSQEHAKELAAINQKYNMKNLQFGAANQQSNGALSLQDRLTLANNDSMNSLNNGIVLSTLQGGNQQQSNPYNSALQGAATGVSMGVVNGLMK